MIRIFLLFICAAVVGFTAGMSSSLVGSDAQAQIYLRKDNGNGAAKAPDLAPKRGSIFLRRDTARGASGGVQYGTQRTTQNTFRIINNDLRALKYWEDSGRKPQTIEEIRSYANAYRAKDKIVMLDNRSKIMPRLEAEKIKRREAYEAKILAESPNPEAVLEFNRLAAEAAANGEPALSSPVSRVSRKAATSRSAQQPRKRTTIYRRPSNAPAAPSRVFKDYR